MKRWWYAILTLAVGGLIYYATFLPEPRPVPVGHPRPTDDLLPGGRIAAPSASPGHQAPPGTPETAAIRPAPLRKGARSFYGELPPGVESLSELVMVNRPSADWSAKLKQRLVRNGGAQLKEVEIQPQESYIVMDGVEGRNVERVVVSVQAHDGRMTRFFAEVDSETGHVTKSWGAVIHENPVRTGR